MEDQRNIVGSVLSTLIIMTLAFQALYSMQFGAWMPRLLELSVFYWILASPGVVGMLFAFLVGLLVGLIEGTYLGSASIGLSLVAYVLLSNIYKIRQLDSISQSMLVFLLLGIYLALHRVTLALLGVPSEGMLYLLSVGVSALIWTPFRNGLDSVRATLSRNL